MTDLEKIENIIDNSFGIGGFSSTERQGLLSSKQVLTIMFDEEGEIQFVIVEGADPKE